MTKINPRIDRKGKGSGWGEEDQVRVLRADDAAAVEEKLVSVEVDLVAVQRRNMVDL